MRKRRIAAWVLLLMLALSACLAEGAAEPDYALEENWAWLGIGEAKAADVFLVCPTVDVRDETNMSMDDAETKANFLGALNMERDIYADSARLFAPYYRQAAMQVYGMTAEQREPYLELAYRDVSAAFATHLEKWNEGRPIILAGFSQGADMCYRLLQEYFGDEALAERLVATYAIGWPLTEEMCARYPQLRPAQGADDTGVIVSFECEAEGVTETFIVPEGTRALSINPLNWRTDSAPASKEENLGACFTDYSGSIVRDAGALCGAYIDPARGVLKVTDVSPEDYPAVVTGLPEGAYHIYDYQFFFRNLRLNVQLRVDAYLETFRSDAA